MERSPKVAQDFCLAALDRDVNRETEYVHESPETISTKPKKAYLLFDFHINNRADGPVNVDAMPLYYYGVRYDEAGQL